MEGARVRWQAAFQASMIIDGGLGGDWEVQRETLTIVKSGAPLVLQLATVAATWTGILGVLVDLGGDLKTAGKTRRILVDVSQVVCMKVFD
jgi:hypothetical protein